ncbi:MAG: tetratricopeptide repeat protein [Deltaproteobacteria bacterium]|nr:tetratricopeptide repeat protein [Deltaproteobacteria bacterium]
MTTTELFHEAQTLFIDGQLKESIEKFTRAHDEGYDPVRSYLSRGVAYLKTGEYDKAIDDFTAVLELEPDNDRGYYYRGIAFLDEGDYECALEDLNHAITMNRERGTAFLARGLAKSQLGREEEAVRDFKSAVVYSDVEVGSFANTFGSNHTLFERSMALLEGERGPLRIVLTAEEVKKLEKWMEN